MQTQRETLPPLMTMAEIQGLLKVSRKTMYALMKDEKFPCFKVGNQWRFDPREVHDFLKQDSKAQRSRLGAEK